MFIAYSAGGTEHLGQVPHETAFGKVVKGMDVVDRFFDGNGKYSMDMEPWGKGPDQGKIKHLGLPYLQEKYPELTYIISCKVVDGENSDALSEVEKDLENC